MPISLPACRRKRLNKCGESKDKTNEDYFTPEELKEFRAYATEVGLSERGLNVCEDNEFGRQLGYECVSLVDGISAAFLESDYGNFVKSGGCNDYLVEQNAQSDMRGPYWGALIGLFVALRLFGFISLYSGTKRSMFESNFSTSIMKNLFPKSA